MLGLELRFEENRLRLWDPVEGECLLEPEEREAARRAEKAARRVETLAQRKGGAQAAAEAQAWQESDQRAAAEIEARRQLEAQSTKLKAQRAERDPGVNSQESADPGWLSGAACGPNCPPDEALRSLPRDTCTETEGLRTAQAAEQFHSRSEGVSLLLGSRGLDKRGPDLR